MFDDILHAAGFHGFEAGAHRMMLDHSHDVVSGADSTPAGRIVIDRHVPEISREGYPMWRLWSEHERVEGKAMNENEGYSRAHVLATEKEKALANALGVPWRRYEAVSNGYLSHIENEKARNPPRERLHVNPRRAISG